MFFDTFTTIHSLLSLAAIATGVLAVAALFNIRLPQIFTILFLLTAVGTSATGFGFTFYGLKPSHVVGAIALVILAVTIYAGYFTALTGSWRWIYAAGIVASLYLLVFVGIAQSFAKIEVLRAAAPTQSEPPFAIAEAIGLVVFLIVGYLAARAYRPEEPELAGRSVNA
ncbi:MULTISPECIES: hypothetical protein [Rhodomicrobium]|uniref:hypothetical protein n=1 Tax=Rhodomicrobium TaxID=1068 RepID=UPI000B4B05A9|nr:MULTISPECIES: hypothetical protein [Rhodomicrobium]